jgi:hypothetical protein
MGEMFTVTSWELRCSLPQLLSADGAKIFSGLPKILSQTAFPLTASSLAPALPPQGRLYTTPPFITNATCSTAVMSSSGLPGTATTSA